MDEKKLEELKKQTEIDNSKLEEMLEKGISAEMQMEFFETLKKSQLFLPVSFSENMFEGIEDSKPGEVFKTTGKEGFDINFLTDTDGNKAVPLFTGDEAMDAAGLRSSVMVMHVSDLVDMLSQSDRYSAVVINPFTGHDVSIPIQAFVNIFKEPSEEEKQFFESLNIIIGLLKEEFYELEEKMMFFIRDDADFMNDNASEGVFVPNIPFYMSRDPDFCENMKYTNIILFNPGDKVLPIAGAPKDHPDTIVAPETEFRKVESPDEFTTVWMCGSQPFYD